MYKNKIKIFRTEQGLTLRELAEKTGISAGYLCHLENGTRKNPSTELMEKISKVLKKTVPEIFFSNE